MHLLMANEGGGGVLREYRKGNWTVQETMVLIEAKKMDEERRMKRVGESSSSSELGGMMRSKPAELRWKWVEDYCWRNGCLRSQNQCNDKWDNLMRDFKKVRNHERRSSSVAADDDQKERLSYWKIEKHERKQRNLPSNMLPQIYEALVDVVERRGGLRVVVGAAGSGGGGPAAATTTTTGYLVESRSTTNVIHPSLPPPLSQQHPISPPVAPLLPLPPPPQPPLPSPPAAAAQAAQLPPQVLPHSQPLPTVDSDTSEHSDSSPAKRRRRGGGGEGTSGSSNANEVGSAISRGASIIAEAIQASEEREERRHRDLLSLHQRRLQIEESKAEITRQGINGLVDSINKLANSILALSSNKNQPTPK